MAQVLSFLIEKGGTGKTTLAVNVAGDLARRGYKVLAIDNDVQGNMSFVLKPAKGVQNPDPAYTIDLYKGAFERAMPVQKGLWLMRANEELVFVENDPKAAPAFAKVVQDISHSGMVDFIIIDNPPSPSSKLTHAAILAADHWIIPLMPEAFSAQGLIRVRERVKEVERANKNRLRGEFLGIALNMYRLSMEHRRTRNELRKHFPDLLFDTVVKRRVAFPEAHRSKKTIVDHAPHSAAADDIRSLTNEILSRIGV